MAEIYIYSQFMDEKTKVGYALNLTLFSGLLKEYDHSTK